MGGKQMKKPETKAEFALWRARTQLGWIWETVATAQVDLDINATPEEYICFLADQIIDEMNLLKKMVYSKTVFN
jgi:hypothetical protein